MSEQYSSQLTIGQLYFFGLSSTTYLTLFACSVLAYRQMNYELASDDLLES